MFINDSINHQTRDLSNKNPEQKANIINPSNIYLNSHTEDNLKLREWLLMPKKEGKDFNFEIKECLKEDFKEEVLTSVLKAGEYWRIKKMKELKIINPVLLNQYFYEACEQGNLKLFKTLIKLEIDIDAKNKEGCSALYLAIQKNVNSTPPNSSFPAEIGLQSPHLEIIHSLINKGADLNFIDKDGNTPLHTAILADNPNLEIIKLLIEKGAKLDAVNLQFSTPLHIATYTRCPDLKIVKLLIKKGAKLDAVNCQGSTPLHTSIYAPFPNLEIIKLLIEKGANLDAVNNNGNTPLHAAIRGSNPNLEIIKLLIEKGAKLDAVNNNGNTPLHSTVLVSNPNLEIIKLLIEKGAKLDAVDNDGDTPLQAAILASKPNLEIIKLLIQKGASVYALNNNGESCAWLMKAYGVNLPIALLPRDIEMEMRRLLANSWSINNICFEGKSLNKGRGIFGLIKNMELLQKFEDYLTSTLNEIPLIQETNNLIKKAYKNTDKNSPEKISSQFHKGKTLIFSSGWKDHGVQVIFINNYMLVVNRGQKRERSSIKVFKIDRNKELDIAHISKIQWANLSAEEREGSKFIYTELPASLGYEPTKADPISAVIEKKCQQGDQKIGNCWWLSNKSGILGILMLENLLKAESESFKSEQERTEKYEQIADDSYALYKYFSEFSFITLLKEYIERPDDKTERDHLLVKQVAAKLNSKNWRYILKKREIIKSSNMKYTLKRGKLIPPPNVSPKIKALPLLYKMNEIDSWLNKYKEEFQLDDNFSPKKKTC